VHRGIYELDYVVGFYKLQLFNMGFLCNVQYFVHESVCFFLCSITRYGMIEDIEEIILIDSYKV